MLHKALLGTLGLLLGSGLLSAPAPAVAAPAESTQPGYEPTWGRTRAPDQTLRRGCRSYRFAYRVTPPGAEWTAELVVRSPRGRPVASATYASESDPARAVRRFRLCRGTVAAGRFTIRMLVTSYEGLFDDGTSAYVKRSRFWLRRPR